MNSRDSKGPAGEDSSTSVLGIFTRDELGYLLSHMGQYDHLTGLPNHTQFRDRLSGAIARATRYHHAVGVMLVDLDGFREVNAALGNARADRVIKEVARRLKRCTRRSDTIGRVGADLFAVVLEVVAGTTGATTAAQRVLQELSAPVAIKKDEIAITATVGVALSPDDADSVEALLAKADLALRHAKEHHRGACQCYSVALAGEISERNERRRAEIEQGFARLTPHQRHVLEMLVTGKASQMIAYLLDTKTSTIENLFAEIMSKMQAESLPDLVWMLTDVRGQVAIAPRPEGDGDPRPLPFVAERPYSSERRRLR